MKKYLIGYTTGVFDLFHVGHLNILKQAKEQCYFLIVGVSTDENVQSYKHKTPVIPYEQRKAIVEAVRYVDLVVPQDNMNKMEAWEKYHFNVLFHGDDWKNSDMYNDLVAKFERLGVDVVFLKHTEGVSTSELISKIQKPHD